ncbi:hypothetical protein BC628DRAFT_1342240 [Trametes gibbosa]|nr:hypothetical protein BC628DRAFT_1342240 [Trametes gibbosa]
MATRHPWTTTGPLLAAIPYAALAAAYSFNFKSTPRQCQSLDIEVTGGGSPPYSALIIPFGPSPLANSIEARRITQVAFNGTNTTASFQLKFPENSQFVAVRHSPLTPPSLAPPWGAAAPYATRAESNSEIRTISYFYVPVSDSTGFGTGGTSAAVEVLSGVDGCFDTTTSVSPAFLFHTEPNGLLITCDTTRIWWEPSSIQGNTTFQGVIPGGESFQIPQGQTTAVTGQGVGFNWVPSVRIGTTVLLVGGDDRGLGSAGSNFYTMQEGSSNSCLNATSPSSTPGSPAGGSYATSTDGSGVNNSTGGGGSHVNVGAIVGGVIGGVVGAIALALVLLFAVRRQRFHKGTKERPVDLLQDQDNDGADARPPEYYRPEPFVLPDPTVVSTHDGSAAGTAAQGLGARPSGDYRQSYLSTSTSETGGPSGPWRPPASSAPSSSTRKSAAPPSFRPVNIIQHDDAGPSDPPPPPDEEPETIELPPAYTNIQRGEIAPPADDEDESEAGGPSGTATRRA